MNFNHGLMRFAGSCAALGVVLAIAGLCMGGRLTSVHVYWDNGPRVKYVEYGTVASEAEPDYDFSFAAIDEGVAQVDSIVVTETTEVIQPDRPGKPLVESGITKLSLDLGAQNVTVVPGDDWTYYCDDGQVKYSVNGGELEIESDGAGGDIVITFPEGAVLDEAELKIGAGDLVIEGLSFWNLKVEAGFGSVVMSDVSSLLKAELEVGAGDLTLSGGALLGEVEIDCGMGSVVLDSIAAPESYGYKVECAFGNVTIDGNSFSGIVEKQEQRPSNTALFFDIECGMGNVSVGFSHDAFPGTAQTTD